MKISNLKELIFYNLIAEVQLLTQYHIHITKKYNKIEVTVEKKKVIESFLEIEPHDIIV